MRIESTITTKALGVGVPVVYEDIENVQDLGDRKIKGVHAYCFYNDKLVIVWAENKHYWTLPGGGVEIGESVEEAVAREVREESNMKVLKQSLIGVQDIFEDEKVVSQTRSICIVEPFGPFISDPDGDITEIKFIDPSELKQYVNWGEIGEHLLKRATELVKTIKS
jgi:ADP-ribose pyrophosphatase YjhB (NUDIX family)